MSQSFIEELKSWPILRNEKFFSTYPDYVKTRDYYQREVISQLPVNTRHLFFDEELVDCARFKILAKNYYQSSPLLATLPEARQYIQDSVWMRQSVAEDLALIDDGLRPFGLRLIVFSGYRHPELQRLILAAAEAKGGDEIAHKMFANAAYYTPHASGGVFDLELWDEQTQSVLPTKTKRGHGPYCLEEATDLMPEELVARDNRRLLHHLLTSEAILSASSLFTAHPFEYWHYGRSERLSAFFSCNPDYPIYYDQLYQQ